MTAKYDNMSHQAQGEGDRKKNDPEGYPSYAPGEDIYSKSKKETNIDPADISKIKGSNENDESTGSLGKGYNDDPPGSDLDVPGSELDDAQENIGSEDEENNYYSLGGDDHNDLDEYNG